MDRKLFQAARTGNVQSLHQLLGENPLMLYTSALTSAGSPLQENPLVLYTSALTSAGSPLHVASAYGHVDFVKEIINLRPAMVQEVNQYGFSPTHMASSLGHTEVARELLKVDRKLCQLQGPEEKTPLHCAAIKGRSDVLSEMLAACPECVEDVTILHDTALHLAIKNSQYGAIKIIVDWIRETKKEDMFNMKDKQGNTVLHLATWKKQRKVMELLLGHAADVPRGLEVNAINKIGHTALDLLLLFPSEAGDREIEEILRSAGAVRMIDVTLPPIPFPQPYNQTPVNSPASAETNRQRRNDLIKYFKFNKGRDSPGEARSSLLVVAALVATATFQFGVNPPGGVWQDNYMPDKNNSTTSSKAHNAGQSIWGSMNKIGYGIFMFFNSLGFKLSFHMIHILTPKFPLKPELILCFLAMYTAYDTAVIAITPDGMRLFVNLTTAILPAVIVLTGYCFRQFRKRLIECSTGP